MTTGSRSGGAKHSRIALKAIRSTFVPLSILLALACAATIAVSYQISVRQIDESIERIDTEHRAHLENLLWQFDTEAVRTQLLNFVDRDDIRRATVVDESGQVIDAGEPAAGSPGRSSVFPLLHTEPDGRTRSIGELRIEVSEDGAWATARRRAIALVSISVLAMSLVAGLTLHRLNRSVLRPVLQIADALRNPPRDLRDLVIALDRPTGVGSDDELDELVGSVYQLRDQVLSSREETVQGENRLAQAARLAGLGHCTFDAAMETIVDCDDAYADLHRLSVEEMLEPGAGRNIVKRLLDADDAAAALASRTRIHVERRDLQTYRLNFPDGDVRHIRQNFVSVSDERGRPKAVRAVAQDVSDEVVTRTALLQSQKNEAIGQLTGGVAHDFNNILAVVIGSLEAMPREAGGASVEAHRDAALEAAERGAGIARQLLSFARRQPLQPEVVDVAERVRKSALIAHATVGSRIELDVVSADDLWTTRVDPAQLEVALLNLVVNARDAMDDGGSWSIDIGNVHLEPKHAMVLLGTGSGDFVRIRVTDSGSGMSPEVLKRAVEPFFTTKPTGKGTGLGLSMVYGFAEQSGGHLEIRSEPGRGTSVELLLPRAHEAVAARRHEAPVASAIPLTGRHVFLIEDDERLRQLFSEHVGSLGCIVHPAFDGPSALALAESVPHVEVILTDLVLPGGIDGRELSRRLLRRYPDAGVVLMSGFVDGALGHEGHLEDSVTFLQKPFRLIELTEALTDRMENAVSRQGVV